MPMPRSNLAAFAANVGSAYEKLADKTTSTAGAVWSGVGDAIKAGAEGFITGTQLGGMQADNELKANALEVSNKTKESTIAAQNAQNTYAKEAATTGTMAQQHLQAHIPDMVKAKAPQLSNPTPIQPSNSNPIQSSFSTQNLITSSGTPYANYGAQLQAPAAAPNTNPPKKLSPTEQY